MSRTRVSLNRRGMAQLLKSDMARDAIESPVERAAAKARADAPVDSGDYKASIEVVWGETDRVVGRVVADIKYAAKVEADTGNLARALDAAR